MTTEIYIKKQLLNNFEIVLRKCGKEEVEKNLYIFEMPIVVKGEKKVLSFIKDNKLEFICIPHLLFNGYRRDKEGNVYFYDIISKTKEN